MTRSALSPFTTTWVPTGRTIGAGWITSKACTAHLVGAESKPKGVHNAQSST